MFDKVSILEKGICGIYKIDSPNGKSYIGQSMCIKTRLFAHISGSDCGKQRDLYKDMRLLGIDNFTYSILQVCIIEDLQRLEHKYITTFDTIRTGYNHSLPNKYGVKHIPKEEVKNKMRQAALGKTHSEKTKIKIRLQTIGRLHKDTAKIKIGVSKKGGKNYNSKKVICLNTGKEFSSVTTAALFYGYPTSSVNKNLRGERSLEKYSHLQFLDYFKEVVLNLETGIFYDSMVEAADAHNIPKRRLTARLKGRNENDTPFILLQIKA